MQLNTPHTICGAKTRNGGQCKSKPMANGRCRMHGGKSLGGIASPTYTTGRYSKYLPQRLLERYQSGLDDPDLLNMESEIALIDARLSDLLERVDTGEAGQLWKDAQKSFTQLEDAVSTADKTQLITSIRDLRTVLGRGVTDYAAWDEIIRLAEQRRKLSESRRKHLIDMEQMITAEQAMLFAGQVLDIIKRNVTDRHALTAIQAEFIHLLNRNASQRVSAGGE